MRDGKGAEGVAHVRLNSAAFLYSFAKDVARGDIVRMRGGAHRDRGARIDDRLSGGPMIWLGCIIFAVSCSQPPPAAYHPSGKWTVEYGNIKKTLSSKGFVQVDIPPCGAYRIIDDEGFITFSWSLHAGGDGIQQLRLDYSGAIATEPPDDKCAPGAPTS